METLKNTNLQNPKLTKPFLEEAPSLKDLSFINVENSNSSTTTEPSTELFEFLTSTSYDVSPAENIIFGGKIIPLNYQNAIFSPPENTNLRIRARSESLSAIQGDKLNRPVTRDDDNAVVMRTSRSLNYCKLSPENTLPVKNTAKVETTPSGSGKSVRPRWYVIMFGMVKFPPEIELKDIKNRQIRRNIPLAKLQSPSDQRSRSPSWRFLNALSCKEPTSVAATAPFQVARM